MPLHDHFRGELARRRPWEGFHDLWIAAMVHRLAPYLPARFFAVPQVHLGVSVEPDVATFEEEQRPAPAPSGNGGVATAVWAPARPTRALNVDFPARDVFELAVYDEQYGRRLVAVIELVSPRNKDRPDARQDFAIKCAAYLQERVSVIVLDIVTDRHSDLWGELLALLGQERGKPWPGAPPLYAVGLRTTKVDEHWRMEAWEEPLALGGPLPTLPLWLADNLVVPVEFGVSYEETCRVLKIS
jgi:hypothetical protein